MPPRLMPSDDLNATIARVTPNLLELLADGEPRTEAAIVRALADRHAEGEVTLTIMRLAVLGQLEEQAGGKYILAEPGQG
jgi:hypothetical protein